ncbi:G-protein coupled receptor 143 [Nymphon striatum]|nr:G-protein coupled receptor 143 [Nymphon striatum]
MTTPIIDRFCCASKENDVPYELLLNFRAKPYSIVSLVSALISACGCLYQVRIFFRSVSWLVKENIFNLSWNNDSEFHGSMLCALSSSWVQFFYSVTFFLNLCYAIDVYRIMYKKSGYTSVYVILSVSSSLILIFIAMGVIYFPSIQCSTKPFNLFVNNFCIYFPILLTMIVNPILYIKSSKEVREVLQTSFGKWTDNEMKIHKQVTEKFLYIVIVFYVCWIPNIINVCVMFWYSDVHPNVILVLWFISVKGSKDLITYAVAIESAPVVLAQVDGLRLMHRFNANRSNTTREHQEDIFEEGQPLLTSSSQFTTSTPS